MKLLNVTAYQLRMIVKVVSDDLYDGEILFEREPELKGKWLHFTLRTVSGKSPGARRSHTGRRLAKACWHVHRDMMRLLFDAFPDAELHTMLAQYNGRDGFLANFPNTGAVNLGSIAVPLRADAACECA